jgi:hypothetical protein
MADAPQASTPPSTKENEAERTINALKGSGVVAKRYDNWAYGMHTALISAAVRLWLWS